MNTNSGAPADVPRDTVAATIRATLAAEGVDLSDPEALAGFLAAAGALLARVNELTESDQAVHCAATDDLIDIMIPGSQAFWAAWDASLVMQVALMRGHYEAGSLTKEGYDHIFSVAAGAKHLPGAA